jgi:hypothetical protein
MVLWLTLATFALLDVYGDYERARALCGTPSIGPFSSVIICNIGREIFVLAGFIVFLLFSLVSWMDPGWWTRPITKSAVKKEFPGKRPAYISDFLMFLLFSSGFWLRSKVLAVLVYIFLFYFFTFSRALAAHFRARYDRLKIHYLLMSLYLFISLPLGIGLNAEYISCPVHDLLALTLISFYFIVSISGDKERKGALVS